jgi:RNA polymerase sigma-70 factor, ECF subfamily
MMDTPRRETLATDVPAERSDNALLRRLRDGDTGAGEELVQRYAEPLVRYLQRLVGSQQVAEELHQATWLSVLGHMDRFDPTAGDSAFRAWIYRIATNKANDHWRVAGRDRNARQGLRLVLDEEGPSADQALEADEEQGRLRRAIEQLPENQKQVLLMRYYGNLKFVEIAEALGCPLNTALGRMHKAIQKLKVLLSDQTKATP